MKLEIFEEEGDRTLYLENEEVDFTIDVYPASKTYHSRMSLKQDLYYRNQIYEYRIAGNPLRVETRLLERSVEPPLRHCVKDGVVLESELITEMRSPRAAQALIDDLKEEVEWKLASANDPITMYLPLLHPEIISPDDYRRHLRQLSEKLKLASQKVREALGKDDTGLQVLGGEGSGLSVFYPDSVWEEKTDKEKEKARKHAETLTKCLFEKGSSSYVGISRDDFWSSAQALTNIEVFLNRKEPSDEKPSVADASAGGWGAFLFQWAWLLFLVSMGIWLASLVIPIIEYSFLFSLVVSWVWTLVLNVKNRAR